MQQRDENVITTGCFQIEFRDTNPIQLEKAYPISDEEGKSLVPYHFTVTNTCSELASYDVALEITEDSNYDIHFLKVQFNEAKPKVLTRYEETTPVLTNMKDAFLLESWYLKANETKEYDLRLWMDEKVQIDTPNTQNALLESKIRVVASYLKEPLKEPSTLRVVAYNASDGLWKYRSTLTKLVIEDNMDPVANAIQEFDESVLKDGSIKSYVVNDGEEQIGYIKSATKIYLNPNSSYFLFNFSKVTSIEGMEYIDTSKVTNMSRMFFGMSSLTSLDLSHFDTSNVTDMRDMFSTMTSLSNLDLSHFDTSNVTNMSSMFYVMRSLTTLDVSSFDTSKVSNFARMFQGMSSLMNLDLSNFDTSNVTDMSSMFNGMSSLTNLDLGSFDTAGVTNMKDMFRNMTSLTSLDLSHFDTSNVTDMSTMFSSSLETLNIKNFNFNKVNQIDSIFADLANLKSLNVSNVNTSAVIDMSGMFSGLSSLTSLDLSSFDTSNVTNMRSMFSNMRQLTSLDLSHFDTSHVTNMGDMFSDLWSLMSLDVSSFDTSKVTNMIAMFRNMNNITDLDLSSFDTSNVTSFEEMFYNMYGPHKLINITYGSNFVHKTGASVSRMYSNCQANKPTDSSWDGYF